MEETNDINDKKQKMYAMYWPATAALYLASSLVTKRWDKTWIILPVAALASGFFPRVVDRIVHDEPASETSAEEPREPETATGENSASSENTEKEEPDTSADTPEETGEQDGA